MLREALGNTAEVIARSYDELYVSDYPFKNEIFMLEGRRRKLDGAMRHIHLPISAFVPGDELEPHKVYPPVAFAGDVIEERHLWDGVANSLTISDGPILQSEVSNRVIFPCDGLGVFNVPTGALSVGDITWRPARLFGVDHQAFQVWPKRDDAPMFTGAFEFAMPDKLGASRFNLIRDSRAKLFRILTALSLTSEASPIALSEIVIEGRSLGFDRVPRLGNLGWIETSLPNKPNVNVSVVTAAIKIATNAKGGRLSRGIKSALDALAHARFSWDSRIGYILLWAAIESLVTLDNREGLSTNVALALLGAGGPSADALDRFNSIKAAYGVRSTLVHNFNAPTDERLEACGRLSLDCFKLLFAAATEEVDAGNEDATHFTRSLIARALAK
ncbi:MAG: hypothetical protein AB7M05_08205 [Alphaproteobacteria bacterium]